MKSYEIFKSIFVDSWDFMVSAITWRLYKSGNIQNPLSPYAENELMKLNRLYLCQVCDRYTRQHMLDLELLQAQLESGKASLKRCCPNCASESVYMAKEQYSWQANHRHCFKLKPDQYSEYKNDVQKWRNAIKDAEAMKAFEEYESKHLANGSRAEGVDFMTLHHELQAMPVHTLKKRIQKANEWHVRDTVKAEIDRAFEKKTYEEYEKGGVTLEEAAEKLATFQETWNKIGD